MSARPDLHSTARQLSMVLDPTKLQGMTSRAQCGDRALGLSPDRVAGAAAAEIARVERS